MRRRQSRGRNGTRRRRTRRGQSSRPTHGPLRARVKMIAGGAIPPGLAMAPATQAAAMARAAARACGGWRHCAFACSTAAPGCAHARAARAKPATGAIMLAARASNGHLAARADVADIACASAFCGAHAVPRAIGRARVADDLGAITTREARIAVALLPIAPAMSGTVVWARGLHLRTCAPSESAVAHALRVAPRRSDAAAVAGAPIRAVGAAERNGRREGQCYPNGHKSCENGKSAAVWNPAQRCAAALATPSRTSACGPSCVSWLALGRNDGVQPVYRRMAVSVLPPRPPIVRSIH